MLNLTTVFSVLTVIVGGICIMLYVSTKTLRDSRDDMEHRISQLEAERSRDKETIASQETAIGFWRSAATGDEKLDKISALLNQHHRDAVAQWTKVGAALGHVGTTLDHVDDHLGELVDLMGGEESG